MKKPGGADADNLAHQLAPLGVEAEETLQAIVLGEADALVLETKKGPRVYTLKDANEAYRQLVENIAQPALLLGSQGTILYCNGRLPQLLSVDGVIGHNFLEYVALAEKERVERLLGEGATKSASAEFSLVASSGLPISVRTAATPLQFNDQPSIALVVTALDDIEALKVSEAKLRKSEERLRLVLETEAVGVLFFDSQGVLIEANDVFLRMVGYDRAEVESRRLTWLTFTPSEDFNESEQQIAQFLRTGRIGPQEKQYLHKNGSRRWMLLSGRDLGDGTISEFCVDITDRKNAEAALQEANRGKDAFLATLAHELRNPLASISNALAALQSATTDSPEKIYAMVSRQTAHLAHLVDDLMEVARISRGNIELRKQPLDLSEMARQVIDANARLIKGKGHELALRLAETSVMVEGDPTRLSQVVANLLDNAVKFTPPGGRIEIETQRADRLGMLIVRDTGVGVPPEKRATIFELFAQVAPLSQGPAGGLGIGLALARQIVELHGGSIEARSAGIGGGSEFCVRLPLAEMTTETADASLAKPPNSTAGVARAKVLVVDDNVDVAESLSMLLRCLGLETRTAHSADAALAAIAESTPQLVFLDLGMPGTDGYETARLIRATPKGKSLVLAALSGWGRAEDKMRTADAGFDHHFVKPINPSDVEALVAHLPSAA